MHISSSSPLMFIGGGKMGSAILAGLLARDFTRITVIDPALPSLEGVQVLPSFEAYDGPNPAAVVLAIKPQLMDQVLPPLATSLCHSLVISIAAGKSLAFFQDIFGKEARLVRAMPNLPAAIGAGMTGWIGSANLTAEDRAIAQDVLGATGQAHEVDTQAQIDAWTAIAGSGPAYLFHFLEGLSAAAQDLGFASKLSQDLALQTVLGAAQLAAQSDDSFATLRENVTSPGGTTAAGLAELEGHLVPLLHAAAQAALRRSQELG